MARPSNVTITLLPVSLSLVHIPRSRLPQLTHPILRQILQPNPTFFNVTCNEIELTLFAEHHNILDLDLIARHDRRAHRSRSGSGSGRKRSFANDCDQVEITCEHWNVLQIDSHSDQLGMYSWFCAPCPPLSPSLLDNSGARVHELSAPLAAAGISILYQSSYMSDFIFVRPPLVRSVSFFLAYDDVVGQGVQIAPSHDSSQSLRLRPLLFRRRTLAYENHFPSHFPNPCIRNECPRVGPRVQPRVRCRPDTVRGCVCRPILVLSKLRF